MVLNVYSLLATPRLEWYTRGMADPDIYGYLDFRAYLRDWFEARRARDPKFSRRQFARLAGKRSPGLLTTVMDGKRQLTPPMTQAFATAMELTADESAFFSALVQLDQATDTRMRNEAWRRVSATKAFREARPVQGASVEYLSHWWYPVVRELAHRKDFQPDPGWIAKQVLPSITEAQARRALDSLVTLGFLSKGDDGSIVPAEGVITTPHEVEGMAVHNYHQGMLERAQEAIARFQPDERHLVAATIPITEDMIPRLKHELNALQERVLDLSEQLEGGAQRIIQVHLMMFPLSNRAGEGES